MPILRLTAFISSSAQSGRATLDCFYCLEISLYNSTLASRLRESARIDHGADYPQFIVGIRIAELLFQWRERLRAEARQRALYRSLPLFRDYIVYVHIVPEHEKAFYMGRYRAFRKAAPRRYLPER